MNPTKPNLRRLQPGMGRGLGLVLALWAGIVPGWTAEPASATRTFRVMTYNIHHGEGLDGRVDLERIAAVIRRERADLVALQEVDKGTLRTDRRDLGAELAARTGMTCIFSNNFAYQGGEYGNAVLTRFPVRHATNTHYVKVNETEQRGLLQVVVELGGHEVVFLNTHLDHRPPDAARWSNVGEIEALVTNRYAGRPVLLCGDFNDVPASRVYRRLSETFVDTWTQAGAGDGFTIPADRPRRRIDYIWISRRAPFVPVRAWVPETTASDHRPVVVEFELR